MWLTFSAVCIALAGLTAFAALRKRRRKDQGELEHHSISAEQLHSLMASNHDVLLFDVRQPLDLLAYPEIIPGAKRIPPAELLEKPSLISKEKPSIVYCTCPGDKTARAVLRRALALHFSQMKFLTGGLAAWKAKGYPVTPYQEVFQLYTPSAAAQSG
jgi:rhodanese-related sulfurtransferase